VVDEKGAIIAVVCSLLAEGDQDAAASTLRRDYPFAPEEVAARQYGPVESAHVFVRDGFVDRYTGARLIFPPVLRIVSAVLPSEFPFHPNWKTTATHHPAFWEVGAAVDHLVPVTRGGVDDESNWITTSTARNSAKMNWTLDELGWTLHPSGDVRRWHGMMRWFLEYAEAHPKTLSIRSVRQWHRAAKLTASTA
jgi:hypothetical protein